MRLLLALRYRLIWAHARSRQGRTILFAAGYAFLMLAIGLLALGGFSAAAAAIRLGHARLVAAIVLAALWANGIVGAIVLGIGISPAFSEASLRRYPLSRISRLLARHTTALLEPFWLVMLAVAMGLAAGSPMTGVGTLQAALPAALLFVITTYLTACLIIRVGEWVVTRRGGSLVAMALAVAALLLIPGAPALVKLAGRHPEMWSWARAALIVTPPGAAAQAITTPSTSTGVGANLVLMSWACALAILLAWAERLPRHARHLAGAPVSRSHFVDRAAALFGSDAPLAGKILRYYLRSPQVRLNYPVALPVIALMVLNAGGSPADRFLFALGVAPAVPFLATGSLSMNLFGFDGQGFSRYFLLPVSMDRVLRTTVLASLIPGVLLILIGFAGWRVLTPDATAPMTIAMLSAACGGLLFFHALAIWTSILAPRPIPFDLMFGHRLSAAANALLIGSMVTFFALVVWLRQLGIGTVLAAWWVAPVFFAVALACFATTIRTAARVLGTHRENILLALEGQ